MSHAGARGRPMSAATVQAVVVTDGRGRPVKLAYRHAPALPEVIFEVLQAGTPPDASGLGATVQRRIVWALHEGEALMVSTTPGPVTRTWHGPHPHRGITEAEVAGPGAVNTARSRIPSSTNHFPLRDEGGVNAAPPSKPGAVVEHDGIRPPARLPRVAEGQRSEGGRAHGSRRPGNPRPSLHRRQPRV
jgi:hypothetical protein